MSVATDMWLDEHVDSAAPPPPAPAEAWRPVVGFEGLYQVSDQHRVWSCWLRRPMVIREDGCVGLFRDGRQVWRSVAVLVAAAFRSTP